MHKNSIKAIGEFASHLYELFHRISFQQKKAVVAFRKTRYLSDNFKTQFFIKQRPLERKGIYLRCNTATFFLPQPLPAPLTYGLAQRLLRFSPPRPLQSYSACRSFYRTHHQSFCHSRHGRLRRAAKTPLAP